MSYHLWAISNCFESKSFSGLCPRTWSTEQLRLDPMNRLSCRHDSMRRIQSEGSRQILNCKVKMSRKRLWHVTMNQFYPVKITLVFEKNFSRNRKSFTSKTSLSNSKRFCASSIRLFRNSCVRLRTSELEHDLGRQIPMWSKFSVWNLISICHGE